MPWRAFRLKWRGVNLCLGDVEVDFALSEDAQMIVDMAGRFSVEHLTANMRQYERAGGLPAIVHLAFEQSGLSHLAQLVGDAELQVPWAARCAVIERMSTVDGGAVLALWRAPWARALGKRLGASGKHSPGYLHLVTEIEHVLWPLQCVPIGERSEILVVDEAGAWGVANVRLRTVRGLGVRASGLAECAFDGWIERGQVRPELAQRVRAIMRLWGAAILSGVSRAALAYTIEYVQERWAFGKPLAHHQGLAFIVAEMAMRSEGLALLVARSAWAMEEGEGAEGTDAWLEAVESSLWITDNAVQLLGGHGYTQDHPVEKWMRDARAIGLLWGGVDLANRDAQRGIGP